MSEDTFDFSVEFSSTDRNKGESIKDSYVAMNKTTLSHHRKHPTTITLKPTPQRAANGGAEACCSTPPRCDAPLTDKSPYARKYSPEIDRSPTRAFHVCESEPAATPNTRSSFLPPLFETTANRAAPEKEEVRNENSAFPPLSAERIVALTGKEHFVYDQYDDMAGGNTNLGVVVESLKSVLHPRSQLGLTSSGTRTQGYVPYRTGKGPIAPSFAVAESIRRRNATEEEYRRRHSEDILESAVQHPLPVPPVEMFRPKPPVVPYPMSNLVEAANSSMQNMVRQSDDANLNTPTSSTQTKQGGEEKEDDPNVAAIKALFAQRLVHDGLLHTPSVPLSAKSFASVGNQKQSIRANRFNQSTLTGSVKEAERADGCRESLDWEVRNASSSTIVHVPGPLLLNLMHLVESEESQERVLLRIEEGAARRTELAQSDVAVRLFQLQAALKSRACCVPEARRLLWPGARDRLREEDKWLTALGSEDDRNRCSVGDLIEAEFEALERELTRLSKTAPSQQEEAFEPGDKNKSAGALTLSVAGSAPLLRSLPTKSFHINLAVLYRTVGMVMGTLWREEEREWSRTIAVPSLRAVSAIAFGSAVSALVSEEADGRAAIAGGDYDRWYVPFTSLYCDTFYEKLKTAQEESTQWYFMNLLQQVEADEVAARHALVVEWMGCGTKCIHCRELSSKLRAKVEREMRRERAEVLGIEVSNAWVDMVERKQAVLLTLEEREEEERLFYEAIHSSTNTSPSAPHTRTQGQDEEFTLSISQRGVDIPALDDRATEASNRSDVIGPAPGSQTTRAIFFADLERPSDARPASEAESNSRPGSTLIPTATGITPASSSPTRRMSNPRRVSVVRVEAKTQQQHEEEAQGPPLPPKSLVDEADEAYREFMSQHAVEKAKRQQQEEAGRLTLLSNDTASLGSGGPRRHSLTPVGAAGIGGLLVSESGTEFAGYGPNSHFSSPSAAAQPVSTLNIANPRLHPRQGSSAHLNTRFGTPYSTASNDHPHRMPHSVPVSSFDPTRAGSLLLQASPNSRHAHHKSPMLQVVSVPHARSRSPKVPSAYDIGGGGGSLVGGSEHSNYAAVVRDFGGAISVTHPQLSNYSYIHGFAASSTTASAMQDGSRATTLKTTCATDLYRFDDKVKEQKQRSMREQVEMHRADDTIPETLLLASDCTCRLSNYIDHYYTKEYIEKAYAEIKMFVDVALNVSSAWVNSLRRRNVQRMALLNKVILNLEKSVSSYTTTEEATAAALEVLALPEDPWEAIFVGEWRERRLLEIELTNERNTLMSDFYDRQQHLTANRFSHLSQKAIWDHEDYMERSLTEMALIGSEGKGRVALLLAEDRHRRDVLIGFTFFSIELIAFEAKRRASIRELEHQVFTNYIKYFHNTFQRVGTMDGILLERWVQSLSISEHRYRVREYKSEEAERNATIALYAVFLSDFTKSLVAFHRIEELARERLMFEVEAGEEKAHIALEERRSRMLLNAMSPAGAGTLMVLKRDKRTAETLAKKSAEVGEGGDEEETGITAGALPIGYAAISIRGAPDISPGASVGYGFEPSFLGTPQKGILEAVPLTAAGRGLLSGFIPHKPYHATPNPRVFDASFLFGGPIGALNTPTPEKQHSSTAAASEQLVKFTPNAVPFGQRTARTDDILRSTGEARRISIQHDPHRRSSLSQMAGIMGGGSAYHHVPRSSVSAVGGGLTAETSFSVALLAIKHLEEQTAPLTADPVARAGKPMDVAEGFVGFGNEDADASDDASFISRPIAIAGELWSEGFQSASQSASPLNGERTPMPMETSGLPHRGGNTLPVGVGDGFRRPSLQEIAFAATQTTEVPASILAVARKSLAISFQIPESGGGDAPHLVPHRGSIGLDTVASHANTSVADMSFRPPSVGKLATFEAISLSQHHASRTAPSMTARLLPANLSVTDGGGVLMVPPIMWQDSHHQKSAPPPTAATGKHTSVDAEPIDERPSYAAVQQTLALETCADLRYNTICPLELEELEDIFL